MRFHRLILCAGLLGVSLAVEATDTPDGAALFEVACARCHDRELPRMPSRAALAQKDPRDIYTAIAAGVMAPYARGFSHAARRAVAEYAAGKSLGDFASGAAAIPQSAHCSTKSATPTINPDSGWNGWGNDLANTRFQDAARAGLAASDVPRLEFRWAFGVPAVSTMSGQPVVADGRVFFGTFSGLVIALDARSGCALWVFEADGGVRTALTLATLPDGTSAMFFGDLAGKVYAIDPASGNPRWTMLADEHPHIRITGTPAYHGGRLYVPLSSLEEVAGAMPDYECCTFQGGVLALDAASGEPVWKTRTIAEPPSRRGKNAAGAQLWAPSGAAVWTAPTLDPAANRLYIVTGDSYSDPAAPESDAIMALAMDSGRILWTTQTLAGDAYTIACADPSPAAQVACPASRGPDLDFGASPVLTTDGDGHALLLAGQKSGWLYALDPQTGTIRWRTEVGKGGIVGGIEWGFAVDDRRAYVAISAAWELGPGEAGGITAVNLVDGSTAWKVAPPQDTCDGRALCNTGQLAAVTALPGVVFSGSLDGHLRAYDSASGEVVWDVDTARDYPTVNGIAAHGGAINGPGPAVAGGMLFVNSGYGMWNKWMPGNVLLAFGLPDR